MFFESLEELILISKRNKDNSLKGQRIISNVLFLIYGSNIPVD